MLVLGALFVVFARTIKRHHHLVGDACRSVCVGLQSGADLINVHLDVSPAPFFVTDCGWLSVGWVSDVICGVEIVLYCCGRGVTSH